MASSKTRSLKKQLGGTGRGIVKASHERAHMESTHALLETLVADRLVHEKRFALDAATKAYYDNLSDAEMKEDADWGRIGEASLSRFKD